MKKLEPLRRAARCLGFVGLVAAVLACPAQLSSQELHFVGQTIEILSGYSEGSAGNVVMQEWGRAVERLHPDVRVIVRANSGGTSELAAAMLASAEPNGLILGTAGMDSITARAAGDAVHDVSQFTVIGSLSHGADVLFASPKSQIRSLEDLQAKSAVLPVRSTLSNDYFMGLFLNAFLGTRLRPVTGYSSGEADLAFLSGEAQLTFTSAPKGMGHLKDGTGVPILIVGSGMTEGPFAGVTALDQLEGSPDFAWVPKLIESQTFGRIIVAPAGTPADRVEALRDLFMKAAADPEFVRLATPLTALAATRGDVLQDMIKTLMPEPEVFAEEVSKGLACGQKIAESGGGCGP